MLLRKSISTTKKFFKKTIQTFKSFLSGGDYERLPNSPSFSHFSGTGTITGVDTNTYSSYGELDKFYRDFTDQWDSDKEKTGLRKRSNSKKKALLTTTNQQQEEEFYSTAGSFMRLATNNNNNNKNNNQVERREDDYKRERIVHGAKKRELYEEESCTSSKGMRRGKACLVAQKLKELEMMDVSNLDHVLDIEEVLHYYSRLTCPAYVDIVDSFFTNMYSEFLGSQASLKLPSLNL